MTAPEMVAAITALYGRQSLQNYLQKHNGQCTFCGQMRHTADCPFRIVATAVLGGEKNAK